MDQEREIVLRTYSSVWKMDRKIYSIEGLKLIVPLGMNDIAYLGVSVLITLILIKIIPFVRDANFMIKAIIPFGLMKLFTSIKLDGKLAHKFFIDYVIFIFNPKKYSKFIAVQEFEKKNVQFSSITGFRKQKIINKTDLAIGGDSVV